MQKPRSNRKNGGNEWKKHVKHETIMDNLKYG